MSFILPSRRVTGTYCDCLISLALIVLLVNRFIPSLIDVYQELGPRAKLKLFITFYQVIASLQDVYGVTISSKLKYWMNVFKWFSLDLLQVARVPIQCIGSTIQQFLITTLWPFMLTSVVVVAICIFYLAQKCCKDTFKWNGYKGTIKGDVTKSLQKRIIQAIIVILYFALPLVSERIFDAVKCRAFRY